MNEIIVRETSKIVNSATNFLKKNPEIIVVFVATAFLIDKAMDKKYNIDVSINDFHISLKASDQNL